MGVEPTRPAKVLRLSKPAHSATLPTLHELRPSSSSSERPGGDGGIRTREGAFAPWLLSRELVSATHPRLHLVVRIWLRRVGSNHRPPGNEPGELTAALPRLTRRLPEGRKMAPFGKPSVIVFLRAAFASRLRTFTVLPCAPPPGRVRIFSMQGLRGITNRAVFFAFTTNLLSRVTQAGMATCSSDRHLWSRSSDGCPTGGRSWASDVKQQHDEGEASRRTGASRPGREVLSRSVILATRGRASGWRRIW